MIGLSETDLGPEVSMEEAFQTARMLLERGWEVEYVPPSEAPDPALATIPVEELRGALQAAMKRLSENS